MKSEKDPQRSELNIFTPSTFFTRIFHEFFPLTYTHKNFYFYALVEALDLPRLTIKWFSSNTVTFANFWLHQIPTLKKMNRNFYYYWNFERVTKILTKIV